MGRSNKLLPKHRGPYQVIGHEQCVYIIEDLIRGKKIKTHIHNLRPFVFILIVSIQLMLLNKTNKSSSLTRLSDIVVIIIRDPPWSSLFDGVVMMKVPTAGNLTRP